MSRRAKPAPSAVRFRDRIKELRRVPASELKRNPKNFRLHDHRQRAAMEGILQEVGWSGAVVAYEDPAGLVIVDGNLRSDIADTDLVPVLVTDLTPNEAAKVLAAYDALGSFAVLDAAALDRLLGEVSFDNRDLETALDAMLRTLIGPGPTSDAPTRMRGPQPQDPSPDLQPQEHYDYVLVLARSRTEAKRLRELLGLEEDNVTPSKQVGLGRCVEAGAVLSLLEGGEA